MTTYILGAGASHHAGYPRATEIGERMYGWARKNEQPGGFCRERIEELRNLYGDLGNLEQVLTELDECPANSPAATLSRDHRGNTRAALGLSIVKFFDTIRLGRHSYPDLYLRIARERIAPGDTVITFNYDMACERALKEAGLWDVSDGYGFQFGVSSLPRSKVRLLKLHGSTNWWGVVFGGRKGLFQMGGNALPERPILLCEKDFEFLGYSPALRDPLGGGISRGGAFPALIMLTRHKRFYVGTPLGPEWEEFWSDLWTQAEAALQSSERVIMIGYSMPAADAEARRLLLESLNKDTAISLWCGKASAGLRREFTSNRFMRVEVGSGGRFEDFLDS